MLSPFSKPRFPPRSNAILSSDSSSTVLHSIQSYVVFLVLRLPFITKLITSSSSLPLDNHLRDTLPTQRLTPHKALPLNARRRIKRRSKR